MRRTLAAVFASMLVASAAHADDRHAAAVASFGEGVRLVQEGSCAQAIPKFQESLREEEGVGAHLDLADCYARTNEPARAWLEFKAAERFATFQGNDDRRELAHEGAFRLERLLLRLSFEVPFSEGLVVKINGVVVDRDLLGTRIVAIAPGKFSITATAKGKKSFTYAGSGDAGTVKTVSIVFENEPGAKSVTPPPPREPDPFQRNAGLVVAGAGVVSLGVGAVLGIVAIGDASDVKKTRDAAHCNGLSCPEASRAEVESVEGSASRAATLSTIFVIGGAVLAGAGAALFFAAPRRTGLVVAPSLTARSGGCVVEGTW